MFKLFPAKFSPKFLLIIAVMLSLLTAFLVYFYLQQGRETTVANEVVVVVAARNIPARTLITADMLKLVNLSPDAVQPGSRREMAGLIGIMTKQDVAVEDQITDAKLVLNGQGMGRSGNIPPDKRAFTIAVNEISGAQGFIKVGDFVDVIGVFDKGVVGETASHVLMQNVQVLATNSNDNIVATDKNNKDKSKEQSQDKLTSVTLAVSLNDAALLGLASEKGKIYLALRSFASLGQELLDNTIGIDQLVGHPVFTQPDPVRATTPVPTVQPAPAPVYAGPPTQSAPVATKPTGVTVIRGSQMNVVN